MKDAAMKLVNVILLSVAVGCSEKPMTPVAPQPVLAFDISNFKSHKFELTDETGNSVKAIPCQPGAMLHIHIEFAMSDRHKNGNSGVVQIFREKSEGRWITVGSASFEGKGITNRTVTTKIAAPIKPGIYRLQVELAGNLVLWSDSLTVLETKMAEIVGQDVPG